MDTHEVSRKGLYRRVNGKLVELPIGTKVKLSKEQGERQVKRGFMRAIDPEPKAPATKAEAKADDEPVKEKKSKKKEKS